MTKHDDLEHMLDRWRTIPDDAFTRRLEARLHEIGEADARRAALNGDLRRVAHAGSPQEDDPMNRRVILVAFSVGLVALMLGFFLALVIMPQLRDTPQQATAPTEDAATAQDDPTVTPVPPPTDPPTAVPTESITLPYDSGVAITAATAREIVEVAHSPDVFPAVSDLTFLRGGTMIFSRMQFWDMVADEVEFAISRATEYPPLTGNPFAITSDDQVVAFLTPRSLKMGRLWGNLDESVTLATVQGGSGVFFSPDDHTLFVACCSTPGESNHSIRFFDAASGEELARRSLEREPRSMAYAPDGSAVVVGDALSIMLFSAPDAELIRTLEGHTNLVTALAYSPDGALLASGSADTTVRLWDMASGEALMTLNGHDEMVEDVAFSPDGSVLVSASRDGTVRLWDTASGDLLYTIFSDEASGFSSWMTGVTFNDSGSLLVVGGADYALRVYGLPAD